MTPLQHGHEVDLVEFCGNWYVDDLPPMMFIKNAPNSHGFVSPYDVERLWNDQFDWVYRELDYAVFPVTLHPDVSGRPQVLLMLERLIDRWRGHQGARFVTFEEAAAEFRARYPFGGCRTSLIGGQCFATEPLRAALPAVSARRPQPWQRAGGKRPHCRLRPRRAGLSGDFAATAAGQRSRWPGPPGFQHWPGNRWLDVPAAS
jgi:hypothetical protein